jgi:hypothetical protein
MKNAILIVIGLLSLSATANVRTGIDGISLKEARCEATSNTGRTQFFYDGKENKAYSITDTVFQNGIEDQYSMPYLNILSKTGDADPLKYGVSFIDFGFAHNSSSPSKSRYAFFRFVLDEMPKSGTKVYNATLLGVNFGGYPFPGKSYYTKLAIGSCEITLVKNIK